jgi:hypothetical protein
MTCCAGCEQPASDKQGEQVSVDLLLHHAKVMPMIKIM